MADIILKNKQGNNVVYRDIHTVSFDTPDDDVQAVFSEGVVAEKTVSLNMSSGDMEIAPTPGTLLTKVTVEKPETLIPENVRQGVNIAGVIGEMQGAGNSPQLHPVTISRNSNVVTITNPSTNGNFVEGYKVYQADRFVMRVDTNIFQVEKLDDGDGEYSINVTAVSDKFLESEKSNAVTATMRKVVFALENLHLETEKVVLDGLTYRTVLIPDEGYFLPEFISVEVEGTPIEFTYDSYTGEVVIPNVTANVDLTAAAYDYPKLRTPELTIEGQTAIVIPPRFADFTYVFDGDTLIETIISPPRWWVEQVDGAAHGFDEITGDYWESTNKALPNSYAVAKVMIHAAVESTVTLRCINYAETANDFGILSTLDHELSLSPIADTENVERSFKNSSSSGIQSVTYTVPQGTHFVMVKFIKDSSTNSYNDSLRVTVAV